jgi:hypothetical protein
MSDDAALIPIETRDVDFYGDTLTGAIVPAEGEPRVYVPLPPIVAALGLDWPGQRRRILRDDVLREGMVMMTIPSAGGPQRVNCLPLDLLPGFLFGIDAGRVKPELQEKIRRYRRECFAVLWAAFRPSVAPVRPAAGLSPAAVAYELATAVANLAREQMELESRMDRAAKWAQTVEARLSALELSIGPEQPISEAQAAELAQQVKAAAHALSQQGTANPYQVVYGELYRRFGIGTYRALPRRRFDEAIAWLRTWASEPSASE